MNFKTADVSGVRIFYREAVESSKPNIVLLHGFPSSSYSFHDLIPRSADRFHVIAPFRARRVCRRDRGSDHRDVFPDTGNAQLVSQGERQ